MQKFKEIFMHIVFLLAAFVSIAAVLLICVFLFASGIPAMKAIGLISSLAKSGDRPMIILESFRLFLAVSTLRPGQS